MTEVLRKSSSAASAAPVKKNTTGTILGVITNAHYKMTSGEIIKVVQQLIPSSKEGTISRILTRLVQQRKDIHRTAVRPYLYYHQLPKPKTASAAIEFKEFWDPDLPLFIHRVMITGSGLPIKRTENLEVSFMDHAEKIKLSFNRNTKKLRVDFKCGKWQKALDCFDFETFANILKTVLELKGLGKHYTTLKVVNCDFNQDKEFTRIAGANYVSVQAFSNAMLVCYNKGTGVRTEGQFNALNIPFDRVRKQLSRKTTELKIGTVFDKTNVILNQIPLAINKMESRTAGIYKYTHNLLQEQDQQLYNFHSAVNRLEEQHLEIATINQGMAANQVQIFEQMDSTNKMILDHDENISKKINYLEEDLQKKTFAEVNIIPAANQYRSDSIQFRILEKLSKKDYEISELGNVLGLTYSRTYYHLQKLLDFDKITVYEQERKGRGAKKKIYSIGEKENAN